MAPLKCCPAVLVLSAGLNDEAFDFGAYMQEIPLGPWKRVSLLIIR